MIPYLSSELIDALFTNNNVTVTKIPANQKGLQTIQNEHWRSSVRNLTGMELFSALTLFAMLSLLLL